MEHFFQICVAFSENQNFTYKRNREMKVSLILSWISQATKAESKFRMKGLNTVESFLGTAQKPKLKFLLKLVHKCSNLYIFYPAQK